MDPRFGMSPVRFARAAATRARDFEAARTDIMSLTTPFTGQPDTFDAEFTIHVQKDSSLIWKEDASALTNTTATNTP